MIKSQILDTEKAPNAFYAIQDARMRNAAGITHFAPRQQTKANAMLMALQLCYRGKEFYINWRSGGASGRPKFAAIKIEDPTVADKKNLKLLEADWEAEPMIKRIEKRTTNQGLVYRVYF